MAWRTAFEQGQSLSHQTVEDRALRQGSCVCSWHGASGGSLGALTVARLISPHCVPVQDRRGSGQGYYIGQGAPKTTRRRATCCRERWRASPPPAFVARARLQFAGRPFHVFSERTTPQNGRQLSLRHLDNEVSACPGA